MTRNLLNIIVHPFKAFRQPPWAFPSAIPSRIDPSLLVEEENSPYYEPIHFYPARIGEILINRYQIAAKLGHGSRSTVWLARDLQQWRWSNERFVALKINSNNSHARKAAGGIELEILRLITRANRQHEGWHFVRKLIDSFSIQGVSGNHVCLVFEPLRESLGRYSQRWQDGVMPPEIFKIIVQEILQALDYLHTECHIIHTDLKPDNIMVRLEDRELLSQIARDEYENPLPQKHCNDGRIVYLSRKNYGPLKDIIGLVEITDFDLAVQGDFTHDGCIQAEIYRAPEVILDKGYTYSADIWSLGVMLWDFLEGRTLFESVDPRAVEEYDDETHLAYITSLLGPAPKDFLRSGKRTSVFYTATGTLKTEELVPSNFSFESSLSKFDGAEKKRFINFVKRMIKWKPEERSTAKELLQDPWLYNDYPQI
jgi:serine/threonine protein kinase